MNKLYIMLKDIPVLEIEEYQCKILHYGLLPISLRYAKVNYEDVMHSWTENRTMNTGKTNAKKLLSGFRISQSNPYMIARLFHFASLSDCYWLKEEGEQLAWNQISLFRNPLEEAVSATALLGVNGSFWSLIQKIHTPELTVQGMAAKAWIGEEDGLYLYKVGKKELAASKILDAMKVPHVSYDEAEQGRLEQIADDILGNEDRHGANFGFYMDNQSGELLSLYPLMDHDHAFSRDEDIPSQTSEHDETLEEAAIHALKYVKLDLDTVLKMKKPDEIDLSSWKMVQHRGQKLLE